MGTAMKAIRSPSCIRCGFCENLVFCPEGEVGCIGCGNCVRGCPTGSRRLVPVHERAEVSLRIDGASYRVPGRTPLRRVLEGIGKGMPAGADCGTGGCWACAVLVDGELQRACSTGAAEGMEVETREEALRAEEPRRIVSFFPNHFHASMSLFTHGCNFACDFCHNWNLSFSSAGRALTPQEAADTTQRMTGPKGNKRTGISGGEPTLNRRWLVEYLGHLKAAARDVRIQVDTNASLLTPDYVDELVEAGMTDFSPDLKGLQVETFQRVTRVEDTELCARHLETAWKAVEYVTSQYGDRIHIAVAIPYHPKFIGVEEVRGMGERLAAMKKGLDVNLVVYQPAFRMGQALPASEEDISRAFEALESTGVTAWCQEGEDIPQAMSPDACVPLSDEAW